MSIVAAIALATAVDTAAERLMATTKTPALAVAVVRGGFPAASCATRPASVYPGFEYENATPGGRIAYDPLHDRTYAASAFSSCVPYSAGSSRSPDVCDRRRSIEIFPSAGSSPVTRFTTDSSRSFRPAEIEIHKNYLTMYLWAFVNESAPAEDKP